MKTVVRMVDRRALAAKRKADKLIEQALLADLNQLWERAQVSGGGVNAVMLGDLIPGIVEKYGLAYGEVAAQWFEALINEPATVARVTNPEVVQNSVRWALAPYVDSVVSGVAYARLAGTVVRHAKRVGRDTLDASVKATPGVFYARQLSGGTNCDFCVILASRGPVYGTELDAGDYGNRYHDNCDCQVIPVRGSWIVDDSSPRGSRWVGEDPGYDFEKLYLEEYKPFWAPGDSIQAVIAQRGKARATAMPAGKRGRPRKDKSKTATGGVGRGNKPPIVTSKGFQNSPGDAEKSARLIRQNAENAEPLITKRMKELERASGSELVGLEYRLKEVGSISRKISAEAKENGISIETAANRIGDALRYTLVSSPDEYVHVATKALNDLEKEGWKTRVKNYWLNSQNPYQGINVALVSPDGQKIELQFHTPESFTVKNGEMHKLYEEWRVSSDDQQRKKLTSQMHRLSNTIQRPPGVENIT